MEISCSPGFVTAIYSVLAALFLSKQELGGTRQLPALQLWLHISLRLRLCEVVSCCLVWGSLDVGEMGCFQRSPSTLSFPKK